MALKLQIGDDSNSFSNNLFDELTICRSIVSESVTQVFCILKKCNRAFINSNIVIRIMTIISVISSDVEMSFPKL